MVTQIYICISWREVGIEREHKMKYEFLSMHWNSQRLSLIVINNRAEHKFMLLESKSTHLVLLLSSFD